jgi:hypothetical protein
VRPALSQHVSEQIGNRPTSLWPLRPKQREQGNYVHDPDPSYSEGRLARQPRNRGATDMDILDLFPKYRRTTFQRLKKEDLPNTQMKDDHLWGITNSSNSPKPNPHPLRESRETAHRADSPPATGVFHESREPSPCTSHSTTNQTSTGLPSEGLIMLHMSSDPTTPGRPRAMNRRHIKPFLSPLLRYEQYIFTTELSSRVFSDN